MFQGVIDLENLFREVSTRLSEQDCDEIGRRIGISLHFFDTFRMIMLKILMNWFQGLGFSGYPSRIAMRLVAKPLNPKPSF